MSGGNQRALTPLDLLAVDAGLILLLSVGVLVEPGADELLTDQVRPVSGDRILAVGSERPIRVAVRSEAALLIEGDDELDLIADALAGGRVDELACLRLLVLDLLGQRLADLEKRCLDESRVDLGVLSGQNVVEDAGVESAAGGLLDIGGLSRNGDAS